MRKLAAILLWGILLFNWVGYRALHDLLQDRARQQLEARLDRQQFDPATLLHLKIASTHLSYYNTSATFERLDAQIEINGVPYQTVARRILADSVEYLCIPNLATLGLRESRNAYFSFVNDLRQPEKDANGGQTTIGQDFFGDPYLLPDPYSFKDQHKAADLTGTYPDASIPEGMHFTPERPPAAIV